MALFALTRSNFALNTANDSLTLIAAANRRLIIHEVSLVGLGTASAANEIVLSRSTGGTTPGGAITAEELEADGGAAAFTNATTWSAQPALSGTGILRLGVNANGGVYRWVSKSRTEIILRNSEQVSIRSAVGTSNMGMHVIVEEP
jgi:hypothetical protein